MEENQTALGIVSALVLLAILMTTQGVRCNRDDNAAREHAVSQEAYVKAACLRAGNDPLACDKMTVQ